MDLTKRDNKVVNRVPIEQIYAGPGLGEPGKSFMEIARQRGIIFMYQLIKDGAFYDDKI